MDGETGEGGLAGIDSATLELVFKFLSCADLAALECVSKSLQRSITCVRVWHSAFQSQFAPAGYSLLNLEKGALTSGDSAWEFKARCIECHLIENMSCVNKAPTCRKLDRQYLNGSKLPSSQGSSMAVSLDGQRVFLMVGWTKERGNGGPRECWHFNADEERWRAVFVHSNLAPRYGHVVTAIKQPGGRLDCDYFMISGGVTIGGYHGAVNSICVFQVPHEPISVPGMFQSPSSATLPTQVSLLITDKIMNHDGQGYEPESRSYHSAVSVFAGRAGAAPLSSLVFMFGGFNDGGCVAAPEVVDIQGGETYSVYSNGPVPSPRFGHSCVVLDDGPNECRMLVSGGCNSQSNMKYRAPGNFEFEDQYLLKLTKEERVTLSTCGESKSSQGANKTVQFFATWIPLVSGCNGGAITRLHTATKVGNQILYFGGGGVGFTTNQLSALTIPNGFAAKGAEEEEDQGENICLVETVLQKKIPQVTSRASDFRGMLGMLAQNVAQNVALNSFFGVYDLDDDASEEDEEEWEEEEEDDAAEEEEEDDAAEEEERDTGDDEMEDGEQEEEQGKTDNVNTTAKVDSTNNELRCQQTKPLSWPCPRQNHCAVWLKNDRLLIYGGATTASFDEELGDSWIVELAKAK